MCRRRSLKRDEVAWVGVEHSHAIVTSYSESGLQLKTKITFILSKSKKCENYTKLENNLLLLDMNFCLDYDLQTIQKRIESCPLVWTLFSKMAQSD